MRDLLKSILAPLLSIGFLMLSGGFFMTYISVRCNLAGYSEQMIGWIQSAFYMGFLLGGARIEPLVRRVGHIRAFAVCACVSTATMLIMGLWFTPGSWITLRVIAGVCTAALYVVIESWLLHKGDQQNRGRILALYMIALYASQSVSQFILDFVQIQSTDAFMVSGILMALSVVPVAWTYSSSPEPTEPTGKGIWRLLKISPFGVLGCIAGGIILSAIYSFTPIFAQDLNIPISLIMALTIAGGFLLQWPLGHLSDIFDRRTVLIAASFIVLLPSAGIFFFPHQITIVLVLSFILGGLTFALYPISITSVCDRVQSADVTSATSVLLLAYGTGAIVGPLIAPPFMHFFGSPALYAFIGVVSGLLGGVGLYSMIWRPGIPRDEQNDYVGLPPTPSAYELDPRADDDDDEEAGRA